MTAPTEPLKVTLEEAMRMHARMTLQPLHVRVWINPGGMWCTKGNLGGVGGMYDAWPDAFSEALGRPVVARDDAAELREAVAEWVNARRAYDDADTAWGNAIEAGEALDTDAYVDTWREVASKLEAAETALLALAASEGES